MTNKSISVPAFELPTSAFLSEETRRALAENEQDQKEWGEQTAAQCQPIDTANAEDIPAIRLQQAEVFYASTLYKKLTDRYAVTVTPETLAGVYTEVFTPKEGVAAPNQDRVLLNFHGGSFTAGSRTASHQESIPIAAVGQIKVISVDYRMGPEHRYPAAIDDAQAVYNELLKTYAPENIGLYGSSSGAMLSAQLITRLIHESQPLPAAVSMSCWGAHAIDGDSNHTVTAQLGMAPLKLSDMAYFEGVDETDPRVIPGLSDELLSKFPPSLVMTSTRDFCMSSAVHTHSELVKNGVDAALHVWEGLGHIFLYDPELPESRQAYERMVNFFEKKLGQ